MSEERDKLEEAKEKARWRWIAARRKADEAYHRYGMAVTALTDYDENEVLREQYD